MNFVFSLSFVLKRRATEFLSRRRLSPCFFSFAVATAKVEVAVAGPKVSFGGFPAYIGEAGVKMELGQVRSSREDLLELGEKANVRRGRERIKKGQVKGFVLLSIPPPPPFHQ